MCSTSTPSNATRTRNTSTIFGLGEGITEADGTITGSRLPSSRQVLCCLLYHYQQGIPESKTRTQAAKQVLAQVSIFYKKANIPMISEIKACEKMIKLLDNNSKLRAIPIARRSTASTLTKLQKQQLELDKTFQIWPPNAESLIKDFEDLQFFHSMKTDRVASFGSCDKVLHDKLKRKLLREEAAKQQASKTCSSEPSTLFSGSMRVSSSSEDSGSETEACNPNVWNNKTGNSSNIASHKRRKTGTNAFIPSDILSSPKLVAMATRMKITPAQQFAFTRAFIEETGGDPAKVKLSYAQADRSRRKVTKSVATTSKNQWIPPSFASLHWDSKILQSHNSKYVNEERLVVAVGTRDEVKLLGAPSFTPGNHGKTGETVSKKIIDLLIEWNCNTKIINMVFDTTSSNRGHLTAVCVTLQSHLQRALLWSGCRHHVGEVILTHVFNDLKVESSRSPETTVFLRFRKHFEMLPHKSTHDQMLCMLNLSSLDENTKKLALSWKSETLSILNQLQDLQRNDYQELAELCVVFLDGKDEYNFKQPGALSKARWMAKLIYSIKLCLLETSVQDLPRGTIATKTQALRIRKFVDFCCLVYCSWWFTCTSAVDAPYHDLKLYQKLLEYKAVDASISLSALKAFGRHLWYLTAEMVPLSLFSNKVPAEEKRSIADRLLSIKPSEIPNSPVNRFETGYGKPKFPTNISHSTTLTNLIDQDSWFFFKLLQIDSEFLALDVDTWQSTSSYQRALQNVQAINVVNDGAERAVKLSSDFLSAAHSEEHYQNVLQIVETERISLPNLQKPLREKIKECNFHKN